MPRHPCTTFSVHPPQTLCPTLPHPSQHQSKQGEDCRDTMGLPHAKSLPCTVSSLAFPMPAHPAHAPALLGWAQRRSWGQAMPACLGAWTLLYFRCCFWSIKHWICWVVARGHGQGMGAVGSTPRPAHMAQAPPLHEHTCPTSVTPRVYLTPQDSVSTWLLHPDTVGRKGSLWGALGTWDQWKRGRRRAGRSRARDVARMPGAESRWRQSV